MPELNAPAGQGTPEPIGTSAHDLEMLALARGETKPGEEVPEVKPPEAGAEKLFAGKYKSPEELEKGYLELQTLLGKKAVPTGVEPAVEVKEPVAVPEKNPVETVSKMDLEKFTKEVITGGELSEASYTELETKYGFNKAFVDSHLAGQVALAEKQTAELFSITEGKDNLDAMHTWAASALAPDEIEEYNKVFMTGTPGQRKLVVSGLWAKYIVTNGAAPKNLVEGTGADTSGGDVFHSMEEVKEAMRDTRYSKDSHYRSTVAQKMARSSKLLFPK